MSGTKPTKMREMKVGSEAAVSREFDGVGYMGDKVGGMLWSRAGVMRVVYQCFSCY